MPAPLVAMLVVFALLNFTALYFLLVHQADRNARLRPLRKVSEVRILTSDFPDALILEYGLIESPTRIGSYKIVRKPWGNLDEALRQGEGHIAYMNKSPASVMVRGAPTQFMQLPGALTLYYGFAIYSRRNATFRDFRTLLEEFQARSAAADSGTGTEKEKLDLQTAAIGALFAQFAPETIKFMAAKETDHLRALCATAAEIGHTINAIADAPADPFEAMRQFVREERGELFVGGATQRLCMEKLGYRPIFQHSDFPALMSPERNTLVARSDLLNGRAATALGDLQTIWLATVGRLSTDSRYRAAFLTWVNERLWESVHTWISADVHPPLIDEQHAALVFNNWFNIPGLKWPQQTTPN